MRKLTHQSATTKSGAADQRRFAGWVSGLVLGAAWQGARNRSRFRLAPWRSTYDRTLARLPNCSARKRSHDFELFRGQIDFFPFFPSGDKTGAERETGQARTFFQRAALAVGAKRRGLTRLPRSVRSSRKMGWTHPCAACPLLPFFANALPCSVPVLARRRSVYVC